MTNHIQWEPIDKNGATVQAWLMARMRLRVFSMIEVEKSLRRAGCAVEAVCGDFFRGKLEDGAEQMIWAARNSAG